MSTFEIIYLSIVGYSFFGGLLVLVLGYGMPEWASKPFNYFSASVFLSFVSIIPALLVGLAIGAVPIDWQAFSM